MHLVQELNVCIVINLTHSRTRLDNKEAIKQLQCTNDAIDSIP